MHSDLHLALFHADQRNRSALERPVIASGNRRSLRHLAGDALISIGLRLREHPPDLQRAPARG